jgi:DNA-binding FadR family transcriptional regulator
MPGTPIFVAMHDAFVQWLISQRPPLEDPATHNRMSYAGHLAIYEAVRARDAERGAEAMKKHLDEAYNRYIRN